MIGTRSAREEGSHEHSETSIAIDLIHRMSCVWTRLAVCCSVHLVVRDLDARSRLLPRLGRLFPTQGRWELLRGGSRPLASSAGAAAALTLAPEDAESDALARQPCAWCHSRQLRSPISQTGSALHAGWRAEFTVDHHQPERACTHRRHQTQTTHIGTAVVTAGQCGFEGCVCGRSQRGVACRPKIFDFSRPRLSSRLQIAGCRTSSTASRRSVADKLVLSQWCVPDAC
jgi:hypothetical protein